MVDPITVEMREIGDPFFFSESFAQVFRKFDIIPVVIRTGRVAPVWSSGKFPVEIHSIKAVFIHDTLHILDVGFTFLFVGGHLAEAGLPEVAEAKNHLQIGILLLEAYHSL